MKRVAIFVILAALTVGFSSCSAVRHCQAPEVEMPGQIASGYTDSLTIADLSWWQFYGDSTLRRVIELTLENNKDMLAAAARVEQMRQLYRISKAERLPNFSAKGLADYETNDYADEESSRDPEFSAKLSVSWELDLWGNLRWAKRKGGAEYLSSVEDWRAMRMTLVAEVATAYFQLMALDNELSIVRRTLRTRSEGVQQAQLRFEGGLTSETDEMEHGLVQEEKQQQGNIRKQHLIAHICPVHTRKRKPVGRIRIRQGNQFREMRKECHHDGDGIHYQQIFIVHDSLHASQSRFLGSLTG